MFEFLFCPQHGLFSPANIAVLVSMGDSIKIVAQRLWFSILRHL